MAQLVTINVAQLVTIKMAKRGPVSNFTAHIYIYIYIAPHMGTGDVDHGSCGLRGPATVLFISRDACSDSIAKLFRACFHGVSHNYRAICCKMRYRTDVCV